MEIKDPVRAKKRAVMARKLRDYFTDRFARDNLCAVCRTNTRDGTKVACTECIEKVDLAVVPRAEGSAP